MEQDVDACCEVGGGALWLDAAAEASPPRTPHAACGGCAFDEGTAAAMLSPGLSPLSASTASPPPPPSPCNNTPKCEHCAQRLEDMKGAGTAQCAHGAERWEENWASCGERCFGACASRAFCTEHGWPLPACASHAAAPGTRLEHTPVYYRGSWVRGKRVAPDSSSPDDFVPSETLRRRPANPFKAAATAGGNLGAESWTLASCEPAGECARRLERLLSAEFVRGDTGAVSALTTLSMRASDCGECLGFCQAHYCCRLHWCPARRLQHGAGTASRYQCMSGPHELRAGRKGRHQVDFPYYCGDPACCSGQWFCRDETHKRKEKRQLQHVATGQKDELIAVKAETHANVAVVKEDLELTRIAAGESIVCAAAVATAFTGLPPSAPPFPPPPPFPMQLQLLPQTQLIAGQYTAPYGVPSIIVTPPSTHEAPRYLMPVVQIRGAHYAALPHARRPSRSIDSDSSVSLQAIEAAQQDMSSRSSTVSTSNTSTLSTFSLFKTIGSLMHGEVRVRKWMLTSLTGITVLSMSALIAVVTMTVVSRSDTNTKGMENL